MGLLDCGERNGNFYTLLVTLLVSGSCCYRCAQCLEPINAHFIGPAPDLRQLNLNDNFKGKEDVQIRFLTKLRSKRDIHEHDYHILEIQRSSKSSTMTIHVAKNENLLSRNFTFKINNEIKSTQVLSDMLLDEERKGEDVVQTLDRETTSHCIYSGFLSDVRNKETSTHVALSACGEHPGFTGLITTKESTYLLEPKKPLAPDDPLKFNNNNNAAGRREDSNSQIPHTLTLMNQDEGHVSTCGGAIYGDEIEKALATSIGTKGSSHKHTNANKVSRPLLGLASNFPVRPHQLATSHFLKPKKLQPKKDKKISSENPSSRVLELAIFADESFVEFLKKKLNTKFSYAIKNFILLIAQSTANYYQLLSLDTKIEIVVVHIELLIKNPSSMNPNHGLFLPYLNSFCKYASKLNKELLKWDHATMMTALDLRSESSNVVVGVAYTSGLCSTSGSCSLLEGTNFMAGFTLAHELGHSFGMSHDGEKGNGQCQAGKNIMSSKTAPKLADWSSCSNKNMKEFISALEGGKSWVYRKDCLYSLGKPEDKNEYHFSSKLPGEKYDVDSQCLFLNKEYPNAVTGSKAFIFGLKKDEICKVLYCATNSWERANYGHPPLEGSDCGSKKWCRNGECVPKS